jgi:hypothetical protein
LTVEFRSTESLNDVDYIPSSVGEITIAKDHAVSVAPNDWMTTETQAAIVQSEVVDQVGTPGFEIILVISAFIVVALLKKKKDKKSD